MQATFQTRLELNGDARRLLERWGELHSRVQRELFAAYLYSRAVPPLNHGSVEG